MPEKDLYERLVEAADSIYGGAREGTRALHAKGAWCEGTFTATDEAGALSTAFHLSGEPVAALIRFSSGPGAPDADDAQREARGFAVKLRGGDGEEADILATTTPAFATRTPDEFLELLELRRPDPATGQPDFEKLGAFLAAHPEAQTAIQGTVGVGPLASFASAVYYSPHTFYLVDAGGERSPVRFRWIPDAGEERLEDDEAKSRGRDYLYEDLERRLSGDGSIAFDLRLQRPAAEDPLDDPTALWPDDREFVSAGRLEITEAVEDPETDDDIHVFDPLRLPDGVQPSDDPILHARREAYSVSAYRRWGRERGPVPENAAPAPVSDIRQDFKRSSRFGLIGVVVVGAGAAAIAVLFGSGANPTGAMAAILALVFGFVAVLFYIQRSDLNRAQRNATLAEAASAEPVTDPTLVDANSLLVELAIKPIDRSAVSAASGRTWGMVRSSQQSGWILMVLIACAVIPWQLWQELWSIVVFVPAIIVYVLYLVVRLLMPGGELESAYDDSAATLEPLGLALIERPQVKLRRQPIGPMPAHHRVEGDVVFSGRRHGRSVQVRLGGTCTTSLDGAVQPFEVEAKGERLRTASGAPPAVESVLEPLRASSYWKGVSVTGGTGGVMVEREGGGEHWMRDLWLAERLADAASAA